MALSYSYLTGQPSAVAQSIGRSIGQFERRYQSIKIGITSKPERRKAEHSKDGWSRMVVKYKTGSVRNANTIEKLFIEQRRELTNEWPGFSNMPSPGPYFVYLLMK